MAEHLWTDETPSWFKNKCFFLSSFNARQERLQINLNLGNQVIITDQKAWVCSQHNCSRFRHNIEAVYCLYFAFNSVDPVWLKKLENRLMVSGNFSELIIFKSIGKPFSIRNLFNRLNGIPKFSDQDKPYLAEKGGAAILGIFQKIPSQLSTIKATIAEAG